MIYLNVIHGSIFILTRGSCSSGYVQWKTNIQILQNKVLHACLRIKNNMDVSVYELHLRLNVQPYDKCMQYFLMC